MTTKKCFKCGEVKPLSEFYKHKQMADGHLNKCKECNKKDVKENRDKNIDYYRDYDKTRFKEDPRVKARHKRYAKTEAGKEKGNEAKRRYQANNPIKRLATNVVNNAVRDGKIVKPHNCESCGDESNRMHGHHDDYAFPLVVRWLCPKCHKAWHNENGEAKNG